MTPEDLSNRLLRAARNADLSECRKLLERGALPPAEVPPTTQAEIFDAVIRGKEAAEGVDLLLAWGFDPSCIRMPDSDDYQSTPFISAVRVGRIDLMETLYQAGADIHWKSPTGANGASASVPARAVQDPRPDSPEQQAVRRWLEEHDVRLDPTSPEMRRQIRWAAYSPSSWPDVPMLIKLGVDPTRLQWTPFMMKIADGSAAPDDVSTLDDEELSARDGYARSLFLMAISAGRRDLAEALIARGADALARGWYGATALHLAAREDHPELMEWLVSLGALVDAVDEHGHTALQEAVSWSKTDSVARLLKLGADPNATDELGFKVIYSCYSMEILQLLLDTGADVNAISGGGEWPLKNACRTGEPALVKYLLDQGAEVDRSSTGETALFNAVVSDSIECVRLLLDAGAEINVTDVDEWTCLYHVKSLPMAQFLIAHGADPGLIGMFEDRPENWTSSIEVAELFQRERLKKNRTGARHSETEFPE